MSDSKLIDALADLERRRDEATAKFDAAISAIKAVMGDYSSTDTSPSLSLVEPMDGVSRRRVQRGSRAEKVRKVLADNPDAVFDAAAIVVAIGEPVDETTMKAVHAILARQLKHGFIVKRDRGEYQLAPQTTVTTEPPAIRSDGGRPALPDSEVSTP